MVIMTADSMNPKFTVCDLSVGAAPRLNVDFGTLYDEA